MLKICIVALAITLMILGIVIAAVSSSPSEDQSQVMIKAATACPRGIADIEFNPGTSEVVNLECK